MFLKKILRKKSIDQLKKDSKSTKLVRSLGPVQLIALGVGAIIGGGVFVFTGIAAYEHAGPAVILSFALSGFICICAGLCYAEFASLIPVSGSSYTYSYAVLGEFPAWLMGSAMILAYFLAASSVASGWSSYFTSLLNDYSIVLPGEYVNVLNQKLVSSNGEVTYAIFNIPAFFICLLSAGILYRGTESSTLVNSIIVLIKMVVLAAFVILGAMKLNIHNWKPFIPENTGIPGEYGLSGIIAGVSIVFLAFNGFDSVCTAAQEAKDPQKNLPIGIIGAIIVSTITYILVSAVLTGLVNYKLLGTTEPMAVATKYMNIPMFSTFMKIGAIAAITSVILVHQYAIIRMLYTISTDGLLPKFLKKIHPKHKTPYISTLIIGLLMAIIGATIPLAKIVKLSTFFIMFSIIVICFSIIYLRYTQPNLHRKFQCPFVPLVPIAAISISMYILSSYPLEILIYAIICLIISSSIYLFYSYKNSNLK